MIEIIKGVSEKTSLPEEISKIVVLTICDKLLLYHLQGKIPLLVASQIANLLSSPEATQAYPHQFEQESKP